MKTRTFGLSWLGTSEKHRTWAINYLIKKRGDAEIGDSINSLLNKLTKESSRDELIHIGEKLERESYGQEFIKKMRNAWRQRDYSSSKKGIKAHLIKFPSDIDKKLSEIAKSEKTNKTDILIKLIEQSKELQSRHTTALEINKQALKKTTNELKEEKQLRKGISETASEIISELSEKLANAELILNGWRLLAPDQQKASLEKKANEIKKKYIKKLNKPKTFKVKMGDLYLGPLELIINFRL
ncbi:TPA: hypothetical protein ACHTOO_001359 [Pseudomonas aeruginosa]